MIDGKDITESTLRMILWEAMSKYSTDELVNLLVDSDCIVRTMAAKQLHFRPDEAVLLKATRLCESRMKLHREIGAFVLGQLGTPNMPFCALSVPILIKLLHDKSHEVRASAISALGHLGSGKMYGEDILSQASHLIFDKYKDVRMCFAFFLGSFDKKSSALNMLNTLIKDESIDVRDWAEVSSEIINSRV